MSERNVSERREGGGNKWKPNQEINQQFLKTAKLGEEARPTNGRHRNWTKKPKAANVGWRKDTQWGLSYQKLQILGYRYL
jgi:hypothetical protein